MNVRGKCWKGTSKEAERAVLSVGKDGCEVKSSTMNVYSKTMNIHSMTLNVYSMSLI